VAQEQKRIVVSVHLKNSTSDIVVDKEQLKIKQSCNQLIQALRNAELEELLQKQAAKK
jgi:molybdate-binding protein